jgi:hypothetical protein
VLNFMQPRIAGGRLGCIGAISLIFLSTENWDPEASSLLPSLKILPVSRPITSMGPSQRLAPLAKSPYP